MGIFDLLIVQPIFNLLVFIYGVIPGSDFGVALIIFTVLVRLAMWPLIKKQLHQTKIERALQPELARIKKETKGNKQMESMMMMELYREKGENPFSGIGILLLQLPIFIALFSVIRIITQQRDQVAKFTYDFLEGLGPIHQIIHSAGHTFNETLLGVVNLSKTAFDNNQIYWPVMILVLASAVLQYFQSKQISPQQASRKRLRDLMAEAAATGKEVDQSEISAAMTQKMLLFMPLLTFMIMINLPGALSLYMLVSSVVALFQQKHILGQDVEEMQDLVSKGKSGQTKVRIIQGTEAEERAATAKEAEIVSPRPKPSGKKRSRKRR